MFNLEIDTNDVSIFKKMRFLKEVENYSTACAYANEFKCIDCTIHIMKNGTLFQTIVFSSGEVIASDLSEIRTKAEIDADFRYYNRSFIKNQRVGISATDRAIQQWIRRGASKQKNAPTSPRAKHTHKAPSARHFVSVIISGERRRKLVDRNFTF